MSLVKPAPTGSVHARIAGGALLVAALTAIVRCAMLAREAAIAAVYGRGDAIEAFLVAVLTPVCIGSALGGALHQVLVPTLIRLRREAGDGPASAWLRRFSLTALGAGMAVTAILALAAPSVVCLVATGFPAEKRELAERLSIAASPLCLSTMAYALLSARLHAEARFALASLAPAITPVLTMVLVLVLGQAHGWPLVTAAAAGGACECVLLFAFIGSAARRPLFDPPAGELASSWRQVALVLAALLLQLAMPIVDQAFAARLAPGSVSAIGYATRLALVPMTLAAAAIGTAINPVLGHLADDRASFWMALDWWQRRILWLGLLLAAALAVVAEPLVRLALERGCFSAADTVTVVALMRVCLCALPFYVVSIVGFRALSALRLNRLLLRMSAINLLVDIAINAWLVPRLGVVAIAIATVAVYVGFALQVAQALRAERGRSPPTGPAPLSTTPFVPGA